MGRWITLCLLLLLLAALTSCGRTANPEQTPGTDSPPLKEVVEPHEKDDMVTVRSASETGQGFYRLTDDGTALICEEFYFVKILDGDESDVTVYYNTTGSWDIEDSQETDMPLEWFWAWEPEYENLPMIPFSATD